MKKSTKQSIRDFLFAIILASIIGLIFRTNPGIYFVAMLAGSTMARVANLEDKHE